MQCRPKIYVCLCIYPSCLPLLLKAWSHGGRHFFFFVTIFREARRFRMHCNKREIRNAKIYAVLYLRRKFYCFDKEFPSYMEVINRVSYFDSHVSCDLWTLSDSYLKCSSIHTINDWSTMSSPNHEWFLSLSNVIYV